MANIIKFSFWFLAKGLKDIRQYQCRQWLQVINKTIPEPLMTRPNAIYDITRPHWVIGIDHDTVCAGVGGTAIRHSTSCAGRRAAACGRAGRHNECCAWWQYHPRQPRPYKWSISILPRSQFYKKQGKLAFSTSCTAVRPHRRLRNDAWRRDS